MAPVEMSGKNRKARVSLRHGFARIEGGPIAQQAPRKCRLHGHKVTLIATDKKKSNHRVREELRVKISQNCLKNRFAA